MKKLLVITIVTLTLLLTGCGGLKVKPKAPVVLSKVIFEYTETEFNADRRAYETAMSDPDPKKPRRIRDEIVYSLKRTIDAYYDQFENDLTLGRAKTSTLADFTELTAASAINITNGDRAKNIIAIALTAFKGGRKSVEENFFREKTTEILISKMRASRSQVEEEITKRMNEDVEVYPLDSALGDIIKYFGAGTLKNAFQGLQQEASKDAENSEKDAKRAQGIRAEILAEYTDSVTLRRTLIQISEEISLRKDEETRNKAKKRILDALKKLQQINSTKPESVKIIIPPFTDTDPADKLLNILSSLYRQAILKEQENRSQSASDPKALTIKDVLDALNQ
jgi:hypothetical protein